MKGTRDGLNSTGKRRKRTCIQFPVGEGGRPLCSKALLTLKNVDAAAAETVRKCV